MTISWGILGAVKFAREYMGPAIHAAHGARLVALASRSADKAAPFRAFAPICDFMAITMPCWPIRALMRSISRCLITCMSNGRCVR